MHPEKSEPIKNGLIIKYFVSKNRSWANGSTTKPHSCKRGKFRLS